MQDDRLNRVNGSELEFPNRWRIPARVFANKEIPLERAAVDELESVLQIQETVDLLCHKSPQFFGPGNDPAVTEVVLTLQEAKIATPVIELFPLMTVKQ
jgi:hypothetical protein